MSADEITAAELARLMALCVDENGVDLALERETAAMSPEAREQSQENLRRFVSDVRDQIHKQHG